VLRRDDDDQSHYADAEQLLTTLFLGQLVKD
jgi:hypothetical protein